MSIKLATTLIHSYDNSIITWCALRNQISIEKLNTHRKANPFPGDRSEYLAFIRDFSHAPENNTVLVATRPEDIAKIEWLYQIL